MVNTALIAAAAAWNTGETAAANTRAAQIGATYAFTERMASLTRKPDADTNSALESWDSTIRSAVAYNGPTYLTLLPHGRETLTAGTIETQLDALRDFGIRLSHQANKPALVSLGGVLTVFPSVTPKTFLSSTHMLTSIPLLRLAPHRSRQRRVFPLLFGSMPPVHPAFSLRHLASLLSLFPQAPNQPVQRTLRRVTFSPHPTQLGGRASLTTVRYALWRV